MILLIDNYDSFVHNLARYVRELGEEAVVMRNDELTPDDVARMAPSHIILSPGPCTPVDAGISTEVVRRLGPATPVLGVCLGHQCIGAAYGGDIVRAGRPQHGRTSPIAHDGSSIFAGIPSPIRVARYHSLVIARASLPGELRVLASSRDDGEIMAVAHREHPVVGVQFHPESAATEYGYRMIDRFLRGSRSRGEALPARADGAPGQPPPCHDDAPPFVPPAGGACPMILETIVTTVSADGAVNCAPMGVEWGERTIVLKPFLETATYRNLVATRAAVVNLVDDVRVFARAAVMNPEYPTVKAAVVNGVVLADGCSWREVEVRAIDSTPPRSRIDTAVVHHGVRREFIGFNRARHAVLEAAIYATRLHLLPRDFVESEIARLQVIVDKTAGSDELEAMALLAGHIRSVLGPGAASKP